MANEPFPDKVVLVLASTEATSTSMNNSNKFHKWEKQPNGEYLHTYGRVGTDGMSHVVSEAKAIAKRKSALKDGYTQIDTIDSAPAQAAAPVSAVARTAVEEIAKGDPVIAKLVTFLSDQNVHNITGATTLKYDKTTGLFSTPLGVVTQGTIDKARQTLSMVQNQVEKKSLTEVALNKLATDFLMMIPTDIGMLRPTFENVFPTLDSVAKQNDILESLEGSLEMAAKKPAPKAGSSNAPKVWDIELKKCEDSAEINRIQKKFLHTGGNSRWGGSWAVRNVYHLGINHMRNAFERDGRKLGNVEEMWHGTNVGNILSIFAKGLVIPASCSNGRNFGNGVYASRQSSKSLGYAGQFRSAKRTSCYMFLVEVAMGNAYLPPRRVQTIPSGYDSMDVKPDCGWWSDHEAIVYKTSQCNVVRLVEFES